MQLIKQTLRYLKHTATHRITYAKSDIDEIWTYCEADFAASPDLKSMTGTIHTSFGLTIKWISKNNQPSN